MTEQLILGNYDLERISSHLRHSVLCTVIAHGHYQELTMMAFFNDAIAFSLSGLDPSKLISFIHSAIIK